MVYFAVYCCACSGLFVLLFLLLNYVVNCIVWFWCCNSVVLFLFLIFICLCLMNVITDCFVILFIVFLFVGCDPLGCFGFGWIRLLLFVSIIWFDCLWWWFGLIVV